MKVDRQTDRQFICRSFQSIHNPANIRLDEDVLMTPWRHLLSSFLEGVFRTFSRRLDQDQYNRLGHTSSRRLQDVLQRSLQDVFKTYHQVKLFLLTCFQNDFETYSERFWDILQSTYLYKDLPRSYFWEIYGQCANFARVTKASQILIFHFTTPFSGHLQKRI